MFNHNRQEGQLSQENEQEMMSKQDRQYLKMLEQVDWTNPQQVADLFEEARDHSQRQSLELQEQVFGCPDATQSNTTKRKIVYVKPCSVVHNPVHRA